VLYDAACVADVPTWSGSADRWTLAADGGTVERLPAPDDASVGKLRPTSPNASISTNPGFDRRDRGDRLSFCNKAYKHDTL
jgi:hypothetical protein